MDRSVASKVRIPTVDEVESSGFTSRSETAATKTNFTKFRQTESSATSSSAQDPSKNGSNASKATTTTSNGDAASTSATALPPAKRKPEEESSKSIDNYFPPVESIPSASRARGGGSAVVVNPRQKGNPLLRFLRNVPYEYDQTPADYILGESCCALFLSLKFHKLNPDYVHERIKDVGHRYALQVLIVQVDIPEPDQSLRELNTICFNANWTMMLAWSPEEAAELLESYKIYEKKPPDFLMGKQETDPKARLVDLLTAIKSITRTDAENLIVTFGSLKNMVEASEEQLALCPGLGMKKAKRLFQAFGAPWRVGNGESNKDLVSFTVDEGEGTSNMASRQRPNEVEIEDLFEEDTGDYLPDT